MNRFSFLPIFSIALLLFPLAVTSRGADPSFPETRGLIDALCLKCHGATAQKGGVNFVPFKDEKAVSKQRKLWRGVVEQLESGEMPPEDQKQPTKEQRQRFVAWIKQSLDAAEKADRERPDPGRAVIRRLNRTEYNRTIRDLTGIDFDVAGAVGMPDEAAGEAFDTLSAALNISTTQMEKYFAAADLIVEKLYASGKAKSAKEKTPLSPALEKLLALPTAKDRTDREAAQSIVVKFARRAYRRPLEAKEVDRLLKLFDFSAKSGGFEEALKPVFKAVLVSPNFLMRIERDRATDPERAYRIGDYELATRLSYFLWSSMPDDELISLAEKGELAKPDVLEKQTRRMLADPKSRALTDNFAAQWLHLGKIAYARPSTEFFPTFTQKMRQAMHEEIATFFDKLREGDRSLLELLDADYTYANQDLAKHYGIDNVTGPEFRKVKLPDANRGGLLGMAGILSLTSHTSRTSPTLRGKYVLDVVLGMPPPPPPPNVSQIDEAKQKGKGPKNFREQLAMHASQASCAGCHSKIDPLGFGLENFNAVGIWRPSSADVDATGKLPTGEKFNGPKELKQILLQRKGRFVENVTEKLFVYALGREMQASDETLIKTMTADLVKDDYRFSKFVLGIVRSYPFQHRRNLKQDE